MAGTQILGIAYGLDIREAQDPYIADAKLAVEAFSAGTVPGAYLVDTIPFCTYFHVSSAPSRHDPDYPAQ